MRQMQWLRVTRRLRHALTVFVTISGLFVFAAVPSSGQSNETLNVIVTTSNVTIDWPTVAGATTYLIVDDRSHEVVWRDHGTNAVLQVHAPASLSVLIVALTDSGPRLIAKVLATVPDPETNLTPITAVSTSTGTTLNWGAIPRVNEYVITADGDEIARTSATTAYTSTDMYQREKYEIVAKRELSVGQTLDGAVTEFNYGAEVSPPAISVNTIRSESKVGDTLPAGIPSITRSRTTYEAYIPIAYLEGQTWFGSFPCESANDENPWFSGDNRGAGYETGKYRTKAAINQYWASASAFTSKGISPTNRYAMQPNGTLKYDSTRTADGSRFTISQLSNDGRQSNALINHAVGIPYCSLADIDYDNRQQLYSNGGFYTTGRHDQMPNHQLYLRQTYSDGTYSTRLIFNHAAVSHYCLNPATFCDRREYQYAG